MMAPVRRAAWVAGLVMAIAAGLTCPETAQAATEPAPFDENRALILYAPFDDGAEPAVARDGAALATAKNVRFVPGRFGRAVRFSAKDGDPADLVYALGAGLPLSSGADWTIAMYVRPDEPGDAYRRGDGRGRNLFRTLSTGAWGQGDVFASFGVWGRLDAVRHDADKKSVRSSISGGVFPGSEWTHLALVNRGGRLAIFVNGVETKLSADNQVEKPGAEQRQLRLGCLSLNDATWLEGALDEVKLFASALDANAVRRIMESRPDGKATESAAEPTLQVPFNGRVDAAGLHGAPNVAAAGLVFKPAAAGQGAEFARHGYDARAVMEATGLKDLNGAAVTAGFYFRPRAEFVDDAVVRGLLAATSGDFGWRVFRTGRRLAFAITGGGRVDRVEVDLPDDIDARFVHIAAGYGPDEIFLALDGMVVAGTTRTAGVAPAGAESRLRVGDLPGAGQYEASQAEGVIDELRIFTAALPSEALRREAERRQAHAAGAGEAANLRPLPFRATGEREAGLWGAEGEHRVESGMRGRVYLNGLWRFQPVADGAAPRPEDWAYLAVPGRYAGHENGRADVEFRWRDADLVPEKGEYRWRGTPTHTLPVAYYERAFHHRPDASGRPVYLVFEELSPSETGRAWLNDRFLGAWSGESPQTFRLVDGWLEDGENRLLLETTDSNGRWNWRGVKGDVYLETRPVVQLERPRVVTHVVGGKRLAVSADLRNTGRAPVEARLAVTITGDAAAAPAPSAPVRIGPGQTARVTLETPWESARLWDFETPHLYECVFTALDADGKALDGLAPVRFGFREFAVAGAEYRLNGQIVRLRNHDEPVNSTWDYAWCREFARLLKAHGYNAFRGPFTTTNYKIENLVRACEEEGLLYFMNAQGVGHREFTGWDAGEVRDALKRRMGHLVERYANSPAVVMWYLSVNFLGYPWDYHPLKMADGYQPPFGAEKRRVTQAGADLLRELDPTRPYFFQAGGNTGPIINANAYFCWWPEAEKRAWAEPWRAMGTKPLHIIETSFPYISSFFGMDLQIPGGKPLFLRENAARFFGHDAYRLADPGADALVDYYRGAKTDRWEIHSHYAASPLVGLVKNHMLADAVKAWRASGISGLCPFAEIQYAFARKSPHRSPHSPWRQTLRPEDFRAPGWHPDVWKYSAQQDIDPEKPLPLSRTIAEALHPTLVHFIGTPEAPSSRAGNHRGGERAVRLAAVVNDTLRPQRFRIDFVLDAPRESVPAGSFDRVLAPGEIVRVPVEFTLPAARPEPGWLRALVREPEGTPSAETPIHLFPEVGDRLAESVAVYGDRAAVPLPGEPADAASLAGWDGIAALVVAPLALDADFSTWAARMGLAAWVRGGGTVLVLEQRPEALAALGLRTHPAYLRRAFPSEAFAGLTAGEAAHWRGAGTLAPDKPAPAPETEQRIPRQLWHYSAQDMVAAYPIQRPAGGAVRTLMAGGKDLSYAAVLAFECGRGLVAFSQMEVAGRQAEPAAGALVAQLLRHAAAHAAARARDGREDRRPARLLHSLTSDGVWAAEAGFMAAPPPSSPTDAFGAPENPALIIVDRAPTDAEWAAIKAAVERGGDAVFAVPAEKAFADLGVASAIESMRVLRTTPAGEAFLPGLDARDLRFRHPAAFRTVAGAGTVPLTEPAAFSSLPHGRGRFFFAVSEPEAEGDRLAAALAIGRESSHYWAETMQRDRIVQLRARLLASLGAPPAYDAAARLERPDVPAAEWPLDGTWSFRFDPENRGAETFPRLERFDAPWTPVEVPGYWDNQPIPPERLPAGAASPGAYDGLAWYARRVTLPEAWRGGAATLEIDGVDDLDITYVNGVEVGRTGEDVPGYWEARRRYPVPGGLPRDGELTVVIQVNDLRGRGGVPGRVKLTRPAEAAGAIPYGPSDRPAYNTESAIRW